jgi:hypothetical protein
LPQAVKDGQAKAAADQGFASAGELIQDGQAKAAAVNGFASAGEHIQAGQAKAAADQGITVFQLISQPTKDGMATAAATLSPKDRARVAAQGKAHSDKAVKARAPREARVAEIAAMEQPWMQNKVEITEKNPFGQACSNCALQSSFNKAVAPLLCRKHKKEARLHKASID